MAAQPQGIHSRKRQRHLGVKVHDLAEACTGLIAATELVESIGAHGVGIRIVRLQQDRIVVEELCLLEPMDFAAQITAIFIGFRVVGLNSDRPIVT